MLSLKQSLQCCLLLAVVSLTACTGDAKRGVTITGNIEGLEAGELIVYTPDVSKEGDQPQSVVAESGKFSITVPIEAGQADWYRISIGSSPIPANVIKVFLDSGELKLTGKGGTFKGVEYEGNQFATDFTAFMKAVSTSLPEAQSWLNNNPESALGTAMLDLFLRDNMLNKDSIANLFELRGATSLASLPAKRLQAWAEATVNLRIGATAPDFAMADTLGKQVSLNEFRGKYVLLDFWASWCGPCRADNPNIVKAFNQYKDKGFTVLGVSLDKASDKDKWMDAIHKDNLQWTQLSDLASWNNAAAKLYHVNAIPSNFLLDPNGVIIAKNLRGDMLDKKLAEILGQ